MRENCLAVGGIVLAVILVLGLLMLPFCIVWRIQDGHVGIKYNFGKIADDTLAPGGPYMVWPWVTVVDASVQTQKDEEPATVPTKGGLAVQVHAVLVYHVDPAHAPNVYREYSDKYEERIVDPYFKNAVRDACAEFEPEALYTNDRAAVEARALALIQKELEKRGFIVEAVMLQDPVLPPTVTERIQAKAGAEQDVQRMQFVLKQKELEAQAKIVEAKGIAESQKIIQKDLSHEYLIWQWIEALREHAKHGGATIYVPTGTAGLPLLMGPQTPKK
jgi:prohibitin 1